MSILDGPRVPALGPTAIDIERLTIYPAWALDPLPTTPLPGMGDAHLRLALPKQREALLLPCTVLHLRTLATAMEKVADEASAARNPNGG